MEDDHTALLVAKTAMERERAAHAKELSAVQAKLHWYIENQAIIEEVEEEVNIDLSIYLSISISISVSISIFTYLYLSIYLYTYVCINK